MDPFKGRHIHSSRPVTLSRAERTATNTEQVEIPASTTIVALGYRERCTEAGCPNLGRLILRYADAGGRPMSNSAICHAHARVRVARDRAAGLKIYYDPEAS